MNESSQEPIMGYIRSRPIRVAFLVADGEHADLALDAIFASSMALWGGRYSLVVPCDNGYPRDRYQSWLKAYDPDIIYSFIDLTENNLKKIRETYGPAYLTRHEEISKAQVDERDFRVELPIKPLSSLSSTLSYTRAYPASAPQPINLIDYHPVEARDRFVDDNFGSCYQSFERWPLPGHIADAVIPLTVLSDANLKAHDRGGRFEGPRVNDTAALLHYMASHRATFGLAQVSADATPRLDLRDGGSEAFMLIVGDSFADRVIYWNYRSRQPPFLGREPTMLIVPPSRLGDPAFVTALSEFVKRRNGVPAGNGTPSVGLCSASLPMDDLNSIRDRLRAVDGWNSYHVLPSVTVDSIVPSGRVLENATQLVTGDFFQRSPHWKEFPAVGTSVCPPAVVPNHIADIQNTNYATVGCWALDVRLERQENHSRYTNVRHNWYFPRRLRFHQAFLGNYEGKMLGAEFRHTRATSQGALTLFAGLGEDLPSIKLPTDEVAFRYAIQQGDTFPPFRRRDPWQRPHGPFAWAQPSDKGRYLLGVLRMFGGLQEAGAVLLHEFWKAVFQELGGAIGTLRREQILATVQKRLRTVAASPDRWNRDTWERVASLVASEARQVRLPQQSISYDVLITRHEPLVVQEGVELKKSGIEDPAEQAEWMQSISHSLRRAVQRRCRERVLFQGHEWRCKDCYNTNWNDLESLSPELTCEICGSQESAPVDKPWSFRLNGFLSDAMREHGVIALVWCLVHLESQARETFFFLGPHELWMEALKDDNAPNDHEADLICVVDGRVLLCEVKSSARDIDLASLVEVAKRLRPNGVVLAVMEPKSARLQAKFEELQQALAMTDIEANLITYVVDEQHCNARLP